MKPPYRTLTLRDVLPSAMTVVLLGLVSCLLINPSWTLLGAFGWWSLPAGATLGAGMYGLAFGLTRSAFLYTHSMRELMGLLHRLFKGFTWFDIVLVSILAGVGEELLIRGALQSWLVEALNPVWGILIASIVFGLLHYLRLIYVVVTIVLGCLFGIALHITQSILLVVIAHTVYDILAFFMIVKRPHLLSLHFDHEAQLPIKHDY